MGEIIVDAVNGFSGLADLPANNGNLKPERNSTPLSKALSVENFQG
jgi:hypothetical protein